LDTLHCVHCGNHALALNGAGGMPVCILCLDRNDPYHRYICSIDGCPNMPIYLAVMEGRDTSSLLLCERHYNRVRGFLASFLEVPPWLLEVDDLHTDDEVVVFDFEFETGIDGPPEDSEGASLKHRVRSC
jgi:hypothetical protein